MALRITPNPSAAGRLSLAANQNARMSSIVSIDWDNITGVDSEIAALAAVTSAADKLPYFDGAGSAAVTDFTSTARSLLDDSSISAMRTTLGVGYGVGIRERLTANTDYYVRTDGNDSNDGLTNTSGGAFLTINAAYTHVCTKLDLNGKNVQIRVQGGTYTENILISDWVGYTGNGFNQLTILGENGTVTLDSSTASATVFATSNAIPTRIKGITLQNSNASGISLECDDGGFVALDTMTFGATGAGGIQVQSILAGARILFMAGTHTFSGDSGVAIYCTNEGAVMCQPSTTFALGSGRVYSTAFAYVTTGAMFYNSGLTITGSLGSSSVPYILDVNTFGYINDVSILSGISGAGSPSLTPVSVGKGGTGGISLTSNAILKGAGTSAVVASGVSIDSSNNTTPTSSDGGALGTSSLMWSDLFLASGGVINWNNGDVTVTHSSNALAFAGASSGYNFDALLDISGAAAGQVKFPSSQNASADANTLDDYEEGTWTPAITFGGGSTGITYSGQNGYYTKIGRVIHFAAQIVLTSKGSSTGTALITGLPFTDTTSAYSVNFFANNMAAFAETMLMGFVTGTTIDLRRFAAGTATVLADTDFADNTSMRICGSYHI